MEFLKKLWAWLLSQTTIDEQIENKVNKVTKEVTDVTNTAQNLVKEAKDVVEVVKPKTSGTSAKITKSGASPKTLGSGTSAQVK